MKRKIVVFTILMIALLVVFPHPSRGDTTVSISPDAKAMPGFPKHDSAHNMYSAGWLTPGVPAGSSYRVIFSGVANANKMIVSIGDVQSVSYSPDGDTVTIDLKSIDMYNPSDFTQHSPGLMAAIGSGPSGQGPPQQAKGMYISTNAPLWDIIPSDVDPATGRPSSFRIRVTGPTGVSGFFKWFWPQSLLTYMGINASTLAGFIDGDQVSMDVKSVSGGALITMNLTYSSHIVKTAKALPLSLACSSKDVKRNTGIRLFGWINPKRTKHPIYLYRKLKGQKKYSAIGTVRTNASGYFYRIAPGVKIKTNSSYFARTKVENKTITSPVKTVVYR